MIPNTVISSRDSVHKLSFTGIQRCTQNTPEHEEIVEAERTTTRSYEPRNLDKLITLHSFINPAILPEYFKTPRYFIKTDSAYNGSRQGEQDKVAQTSQEEPQSRPLPRTSTNFWNEPKIAGGSFAAAETEAPKSPKGKLFGLLNGMLEYAKNEFHQMTETDLTQNPRELRERVGFLQEFKSQLLATFLGKREKEPERSGWSSSMFRTLDAFSMDNDSMMPGSLFCLEA